MVSALLCFSSSSIEINKFLHDDSFGAMRCEDICSALAERAGQTEVGQQKASGFRHRVLYTWWLLWLSVEGP